MGEQKRESPETELALLRQSVDTLNERMTGDSRLLSEISRSLSQLREERLSLDLMSKSHRDRLIKLESESDSHVLQISGIKQEISNAKGGLTVAKWAFGIVSGIVWVVFAALIREGYQELSTTHDIAILNQQALQRFTQYPEDKRQ